MAPGVPRLRGEVPEGRGSAGYRPPRPCTLPNPARLPAAPGPGRRSPSPARPGPSATTDSCRAGARQRVWRGSAQEPRARVAHLHLRQSPARPEKWPGQLRWGGLVAALGGVLSPGKFAVSPPAASPFVNLSSTARMHFIR